ncbi:MAG: GntR family transcriptional regulator [Candidatus Eremiobacteraeota bacterium]|nr:GntR family transcriptional regulator [Candidatus Eremiobacteraeota bacterium]
MPADVLIEVDSNLETAPYLQIFEQIRAAIERGQFPPDAVLPTVRQLAGDLGVAPNTVARAYADLQQAGWLVSEGRRGTRVASKTPAADRRARLHALTEAVSHFIETLRHRGYTKEEIAAKLDDARRSELL